MVEHEPAARRLDQRRRETDLVGVPPGAPACRQHALVLAPVLQIGREGDPDIRGGRGPRTMEQRKAAVDATRQHRRILVVRLHDQSQALECTEVRGQGQRDAGTRLTERRIGHGILPEFLNEGDPRILNAPLFFRMVSGIGTECGLAIDRPPVDAVGRSRRAQVRVPAAILGPAQQQRGAVGQSRGPGVEHGVDGVRPVVRGENRVSGVPVEERLVVRRRHQEVTCSVRASAGSDSI